MRRTTSVDTCVNNLLYMRASFYWRKSGTALARFCGVTGVGNGDTISKDCGLEPEPDIFHYQWEYYYFSASEENFELILCTSYAYPYTVVQFGMYESNYSSTLYAYSSTLQYSYQLAVFQLVHVLEYELVAGNLIQLLARHTNLVSSRLRTSFYA